MHLEELSHGSLTHLHVAAWDELIEEPSSSLQCAQQLTKAGQKWGSWGDNQEQVLGHAQHTKGQVRVVASQQQRTSQL